MRNAVLVRFLLLAALSGAVLADGTPMIDFSKESVASQVKANGRTGVKFQNVDTALEVVCAPSENGYPGVQVRPANGQWDLSAHGKVEIEIKNLSTKKLPFFVRIDNPGDWKKSPWNMERRSIAAGKTGVVSVYFGYSWGKRGYKLDPSKVSMVLIYTGRVKKGEAKFQIMSIRGAGKSGEKPSNIISKLKPKGSMIDFSKYNTDRVTDRGTQTTISDGKALITFPAEGKSKWPGAFFGTPAKKSIWDLSDHNRVEFDVYNPGQKPITLNCRVDNRNANGTRHCVTARATVPAGAEKTLTASFIPNSALDLNQRHRSFSFDSSKVQGVLVFIERKPGVGEQKVVLKGVRASSAPAPEMPDWLGKRPPVPGNWEMTFEDNFDGTTLDHTKWNIPNKKRSDGKEIHPMQIDGAKSWWGRDNLIHSKNAYVENGCMKIKCQKSSDLNDPALKKQKYVTSVVTSFGKFSQKYGYFESRMKVPVVRGMWPAFWMMPDRGKEAGIWWKRNSTHDGGMEFDIMEYLGRYGPYRYNVAMHWDGYKKEHKAAGTEDIYVQPDKDGFITSGLLWEPGKATFYCNGKVIATYESERVANVPGHLIYTMPVGGWGTNGIVDDAKLPAYFAVDYVRVWQKQ